MRNTDINWIFLLRHPPWTTQNILLLRNDISGQITVLKFHKTQVFKKDQHAKALTKAFRYIFCYSSSSPNNYYKPYQFHQIQLSEDLQLNWGLQNILGIRKRPHFSICLIYLLFTCFSNFLQTTERRLTGWWCLEADLSPTLLNTDTSHRWDFRAIWKIRFL